jgi:CHAT domain-containing protein
MQVGMPKISNHTDLIFERLTRLRDVGSRIKYLNRHGLLSPLTVKELAEAVSRMVRTDLSKAHRLAAVAVTVANRLGDSESRGYAARAMGNALWFQGRNAQAAQHHSRATRLFEHAGNRIEAGRTLSSSIQPLILLGEYERALQAAKRARKIFTAVGAEVRLARLDINVGNVFHRQDRFRQALACYEKAYSRLLPAQDSEGIIAALHNAAVCLIALNEFEEALSTYRLARKYARQKRMPLAVAQAEYNISYLHYLRGRYGRAIEMLRAARTFSEKAGDAYHAALCRLDLSEIYLELNLNQEAAELAQEAYRGFQELGMGYEAAKALCSSAIAFVQQGRAEPALDVFAQARRLFVKEKNAVWPSLIELYRACACLRENRIDKARRHCLAALKFFRSSPLLNRAALCRLLLARCSLAARRIGNARRECQAALRGLSRKSVPLLLYEGHLVMGQIEEAAGNIHQARRQYHLAKGLLNTLRSRVYGEELKISFMSNRLEVFEHLVEICLAQESTQLAQEEAWTYVEEAKSRNLLEIIARQADRGAHPGHPKNGMRKVYDLREQLNWYYRRIEAEQLGREPATEKRLHSLRKLADQSEQHFLKALREASTARAHNGAGTPQMVSLTTLRETLGERAALVEYFRVGDRILATVITDDSLQITPVGDNKSVREALGLLQFQLSKFRLAESYVRQFERQLLEAITAHLFELYQVLVAPIRDQLKQRHLIVVPHELLHNVPFHGLFDGAQYLIDAFTVSYAPSASIYVQCCRKRIKPTGGALILGVPDSRTPSICQEIEAVSRAFPDAKVFLGPKASAKVLREKGAGSRLIHLATHASFRQERPVLSGIHTGDRFLNVYDLYRMRLPAEQITLSGCSTGVNVIAPGDEPIGLMRGLLAAGARSLLLSLWDVNDDSTTNFMKAFYGNLDQTVDRATALQRAMWEVRTEHPHPYYWAPFILVGNVFR